jgi:hypothetical protein
VELAGPKVLRDLGHVIERGTARRPHLLVEAFHLGGRDTTMA